MPGLKFNHLSIRVRSHVRFVRNPHGLLHFWFGNVSTGVVTWSALRCGASGESGKKVAAAPLSKTAAAAAAAKTWFAKHPLDYMLHNRFPWKRSGRRSSMWPPYSLRWNLSAAACRLCDRSLMGLRYRLIRATRWTISQAHTMMTSSNGNIFRVTGHLCGEFTGPRWIPRTKASDPEVWCILWSATE